MSPGSPASPSRSTVFLLVFDYDNDGWEDIFVAGYKITNVGDVAADYLGLPHRHQRAFIAIAATARSRT